MLKSKNLLAIHVLKIQILQAVELYLYITVCNLTHVSAHYTDETPLL